MSYSSEVLADSPIGYWKLDEASGTTCTDSSGNGRNIGYQGTPHYQQTGPILSDSPSYAVGFDAVNYENAWKTYVSWQTVASPSIEIWVKSTDTVSTYKSIFGFGSSNTYASYLLWVNSSGYPQATVKDLYGSVRTASGSTSILDGEFHQLVLACDALTSWNLKLYVDKVQVDSVSAPGYEGSILQTANFRIGSCDSTATHALVADYAHASLYNGQLSSTRVTAHYDAAIGNSVKPTTGSELYTGQTSTLTKPNPIYSSEGYLLNTGNIPAITSSVVISTQTGSLLVTGLQATIDKPNSIYSVDGSLLDSGNLPGLYNPVRNGVGTTTLEPWVPLARYGNSTFWWPARSMALLGAQELTAITGAIQETGQVPLVKALSLEAALYALATAAGDLYMAMSLEGVATAQSTATGSIPVTEELAGGAVAESTAMGVLSPQPVAGSAQAVATAAGALASLIELTADAEAGATVLGNPDVLVAIAGAAAALASASASLGQSFLLSGNAAALATAAGAITQQLGVIGAAAGRAGATGALDVEGQELALASSAAAAATATAALSGVTHLAGAAAAQGTGAAVLTQDKPLGGAATGRATATGSLGAVSNLEGDAEALATLTGALDQSLVVAGAAQAVATAAGSLSQTLAMQGAASSKSSATGSLGVAETITGGITYAVNLDTGAVTTWNNCAFERLVKAHGKLYGLLAGVLYRIEGDTDPGSVDIKSQVRFAPSNFGSSTLNSLYKVYMTSREIKEAEVTPIYDETTSISYTSIPNSLSGLITHRTNIGRGNRWRTLGLQVSNKQGCQLDIGGLELLIQPLSPRVP